jgi:hypothetical protein
VTQSNYQINNFIIYTKIHMKDLQRIAVRERIFGAQCQSAIVQNNQLWKNVGMINLT